MRVIFELQLLTVDGLTRTKFREVIFAIVLTEHLHEPHDKI